MKENLPSDRIYEVVEKKTGKIISTWCFKEDAMNAVGNDRKLMYRERMIRRI